MAAHPNKSVGALGEDSLLRLLIKNLPQSPATTVGPGDDCAVIRRSTCGYTLLKTDCIIEGVHFTAAAPPAQVGWKALCRVISDCAAMGGAAREALITLALPAATPTRWVEQLYTGIRKAAQRYSVGIAGGETSAMPRGGPILISVAATGHCPSPPVLRSTARPRDAILVTGRLGGSIRSWHLTFTPRTAEGQWLASHVRPTAMMDLSDGLAADLPRLAAASSVGFSINPALLPRRRGANITAAMSDGEDYELLFTIGQRALPRLMSTWPATFAPLTVIGEINNQESGESFGAHSPQGWQHWKNKPVGEKNPFR